MQYIKLKYQTDEVDLFSDDDMDGDIQPIPREDYERLIEFLQDYNPPAILPIQIAYYAGLRIGDACELACHVFASHPELLPFSKSTFYRYVDLGLLDVKNIDLQRKVRFRVKKEYDYSREKIDHKYRLGRQYHDFQDYMELHPMASIVEMDTVIGTSGGKGGKCFLTLLFRTFNFMLIYLLPYKRVQYVNEVFQDLKKTLGDFEFSRLFEVILTDNGTEFYDPESIELSSINGERLSYVFFCDPNASWQKGSIEKNHEYIRYVLPKGTSFAGLTQEDCNLLASHINSVPRKSLNNQSPFEAGQGFIGLDNISKLGISQIPYDDVNLSIRLLRK